MAHFITAEGVELFGMEHLSAAVVANPSAGFDKYNVTDRAAIKVGDFVVLTPFNASTGAPNYITKATETQLAGKTATHIVAMGDMVTSSHIPVEYRDYRISPVVNATAASGTPDASTPIKHIALFKIRDWSDIVPDADGKDTIADPVGG